MRFPNLKYCYIHHYHTSLFALALSNKLYSLTTKVTQKNGKEYQHNFFAVVLSESSFACLIDYRNCVKLEVNWLAEGSHGSFLEGFR